MPKSLAADPPEQLSPAQVESLCRTIDGLSATLARAKLGGYLNQASGARDLWEAFGYRQYPPEQEFWEIYERSEVGGRIVDEFASATWGEPPEVFEDRDTEKDTEFEGAWKALASKFGIWAVCERLDKIQQIGHYGILLMGVSGDEPLGEELPEGIPRKLLYLQPYRERHAQVKTWQEKPGDARFGLPLDYTLNTGFAEYRSRALRKPLSHVVHWSRVIHAAEGCLEDEVYGEPRLRRILNRLYDLEKVVGGGAEAVFRNATRIIHMAADADSGFPTDADDPKVKALEEKLQEFVNNARSFLFTKGGKLESLSPEFTDPSPLVGVLGDLICAGVAIPKRIFFGSERGELASQQDERAWWGRVAKRQATFAEFKIARPIIDFCIRHGILPSPKRYKADLTSGYELDWPRRFQITEQQEAEIRAAKARALTLYASGKSRDIVTREEFREHFLDMEREPEGGFPQPQDETDAA